MLQISRQSQCFGHIQTIVLGKNDLSLRVSPRMPTNRLILRHFMNRKKKLTWLPIVALLALASCCLAFSYADQITRLSMKMNVRTLQNGHYIMANADIFYKQSGGVLVTRFTDPFENVVYTNSYGLYKMYDSETNSVTMRQSEGFSSENSFVYYFLRGELEDMGLKSSGFQLSDTQIEDGMVVTKWDIKPDYSSYNKRAEMVFKDNLPIFVAFYDAEDQPVQKIYYSKYTDIGQIKMPTTITEFFYNEGDSTITKRIYTDFQMNQAVPESAFEINIPADAKVHK